MYILVINSGSSSVKYKLFDVKDKRELAKGIVERIGLDKSGLSHITHGRKEAAVTCDIPTHKAAVKLALEYLTDKQHGAIEDTSEIAACGHRVVHGGEEFSGSVVITEKVTKAIRMHFDIAPLHNPPNLLGIEVAMKLLPDIKHIAVFDTAFHQTIPASAYLYGLPYEFYRRDKIRRYGFHGTSHKYVALRAAAVLKKPVGKLKLITVHLGNGCSITAVKNGRSVNTSMGFTPLEGLLMGTRSGDIDPAVVFYLMHKKNLSYTEIDRLLNKESGLLGMSGISSDMRDVYSALKKGHRESRLAFEVFVERIQKYIGAYAVSMNGVDAIVFTAGIGENHPPTRKAVLAKLGFLGVRLDGEKNNSPAKEKVITSNKRGTRAVVIPTNEELMIAEDTRRLVR